jgi:hypothetical protein
MADFTILAIAAPCKQVARAYMRIGGDVDGAAVGCLKQKVRIVGEDWTKAIFVFQLRNSQWTHIQSPCGRVAWCSAEEMSRHLKAKLLAYCYSDTGGVFGYYLYDSGTCIEQFGWGDTPEFDNSNRAAKIAAGWQLSDNNLRHFRSQRLGEVDMNSREVMNLPHQVARDLGVYVPFVPFAVSPKSELVQLVRPWTHDDLEDARVLLST